MLICVAHLRVDPTPHLMKVASPEILSGGGGANSGAELHRLDDVTVHRAQSTVAQSFCNCPRKLLLSHKSGHFLAPHCCRLLPSCWPYEVLQMVGKTTLPKNS